MATVTPSPVERFLRIMPMRRDTKILIGGAIIISTITVLAVLLASLEFLSNQAQTAVPSTENTNLNERTESEIVILHDSPVTVDRFDLIVTLQSHRKLNAAAVDTTIDVGDLGTIHFTGIGETMELQGFRFRLLEATDSSVQLFIAQPSTSL